MTDRIGPRCPYTLAADRRPVLAAVSTARAAGRPIPASDWRCVREPHPNAGGEQHLALPLGVTGRSVRFAAVDAEPLPATAYMPDVAVDPPAGDTVPVVHAFYSEDGDRECTRRLRNGLACGAGPYEHMLAVDQALDAAGSRPRVADPADVRALVELIESPGTTCVHVTDGDELLLLMPEADDTGAIEQATQALADLFPTVTFLVLQGITGAVLMPPRPQPIDISRELTPGEVAAYEQLAAGHSHLTARRAQLIDQGAAPADLCHPIRPIPPAGYQPPPRKA